MVQKLRGYNELLDELQKLKLEYEAVQREKISPRDRLSEESEKQRDTDENHQNRVNGLLNEFKKVKTENDQLQSQSGLFKRTQLQEEKQNISDLMERIGLTFYRFESKIFKLQFIFCRGLTQLMRI